MTRAKPALEPVSSLPIVSGGCVRLKSGGPTMTVRATDGDDVDVEWFENATLHGHRFKIHSLVGCRSDRLPVLMIDLGGSETNAEPH